MYQTLKYVLTCCTMCFSLSELLNIDDAFELKDKSNLHSAVRSRMNDVVPLLNKYSVMCIHLQSEYVLYEFIEVYGKTYVLTILIIDEFDESVIETCDGVVALEIASNNTSCGEIFRFLSQISTLIYFVDNTTTAVVSSLAACLSVTQSQEVLALSLSDGSLLQLSSVFPQPRHFVSTSVTEVLQRRREPEPTKRTLEGTSVTVAIMDYIPFTIFNETVADLQLEQLDGIEALLLKELVRQLNFTVRLLLCDGWGSKLANGSWRGGIAQPLQDGVADLSFANLWQIISAYDIFDLGPSLTKIKVSFLVRRPEQIDFRWQSFLTIFKPQVWFAVLASFLLVVAAYWAGVKLDIHLWKQSWSSSFLTIFGYFLGSYSQNREREGNTRYTLTSWSVFSLLVTTSLSSGIITRLAIPLYEPRVDSLQQLVEGHYYWTVQYYRDYNNDSDLIESMFDFKNLWARMFEKTYKYMDPGEISTKIKTNKNITFPVQRYNDFIIIDNVGLNGNKALYDFRLSKEEITSTHVAFGVKKNSPLFEQLSVATLNILEAGLMTRWKEEVVRRWPQYDTSHFLIEKDVPTFGEPQKLKLNKLQPVFYILLFGSTVACCVFLVEILW